MAASGLQLYELIMLICGCVLFLAITVILVFFVIKNRKFSLLLPFYVVPFLMIGFPALKSIKFKDWEIEINQKTEIADNDISDSTNRAELKNTVSQISFDQAKENPDVCVKLARARYVLGDYDSASFYVNLALAGSADNLDAKVIQGKINAELAKEKSYQKAIVDLHNYLENLKKTDLTDTAYYATLDKKLEDILRLTPRYSSEQQALVIAEAFALAHRTEQAKKIIANVKTANVNSMEADTLSQKIDNGKVTTAYKLNTAQRMRAPYTNTAKVKSAIVLKK